MYCKCTTLRATKNALQVISGQRLNLKWGRKACMNVASSTVHISTESFVACFAQRTSSLFETECIGLMFVRFHPPLHFFHPVFLFCSSSQYSYISLKSECFPPGNFGETGRNKLLSFSETSWYTGGPTLHLI